MRNWWISKCQVGQTLVQGPAFPRPTSLWRGAASTDASGHQVTCGLVLGFSAKKTGELWEIPNKSIQFYPKKVSPLGWGSYLSVLEYQGTSFQDFQQFVSHHFQWASACKYTVEFLLDGSVKWPIDIVFTLMERTVLPVKTRFGRENFSLLGCPKHPTVQAFAGGADRATQRERQTSEWLRGDWVRKLFEVGQVVLQLNGWRSCSAFFRNWNWRLWPST